MANIKINLESLAPELSKKIDRMHELIGELNDLSRELYYHDITAECEICEHSDNDSK